MLVRHIDKQQPSRTWEHMKVGDILMPIMNKILVGHVISCIGLMINRATKVTIAEEGQETGEAMKLEPLPHTWWSRVTVGIFGTVHCFVVDQEWLADDEGEEEDYDEYVVLFSVVTFDFVVFYSDLVRETQM